MVGVAILQGAKGDFAIQDVVALNTEEHLTFQAESNDEQIKPKRGASKKALFNKNVMDEMEVVLQSRSINKQDLSQEKLPAQPDGSEEPEEKLTVSERVAKLSQNLTQAVAARTDTGFYKDQEEKSKSPLPVEETDEGTETINVSVAERVAKLGQSLSHAVAARPSVVEKSREPIPQQDEQNIEAEHKELTISDRI